MQAPLGRWEVVGGNSGEGWGVVGPVGFSHPCTTYCGADPSRTQEVLPVPFQHHKLFLWVISCWPQSSCPKMDQNKGQAILIMKVLQAKTRCLPQLLRSLTPAGPRSWLSSLMSSGLGAVARFRQHLRQFSGTPGSSSFTVSLGNG